MSTRQSVLRTSLWILGSFFALFALVIVLTMPVKKSEAVVSDTILSVSNIGDDKNPIYVLYWTNNGVATTVRRSDGGSFTLLSETTDDHYLDYTAKANVAYTYEINQNGQILTINSTQLSLGKPSISNIKIEAGATSRTEASVIVTFRTDKLAKAQVFYGSSANYDSQTQLEQSLNQSHTILIEKLKPQTSYHFKVRAQDKTDKQITESSDQVFTTAAEPSEQTLLSIIIEALSKAFAGFAQWFKS